MELKITTFFRQVTDDGELLPKSTVTSFSAPSIDVDNSEVLRLVELNLKKKKINFIDHKVVSIEQLYAWEIKISGWDLRGRHISNQFTSFYGTISKVKKKAKEFYENNFAGLPKKIWVYEANMPFNKARFEFNNWSRFKK